MNPDSRSAFAFRLVVACLCAAALVTLVDNGTRLSEYYDDYRHAWISAHFAITGRVFAEHGVIALHAIPLVNNPPFGNPPEAYMHWPAGFSILLSWLFGIFGESEALGHGLMLLLNCINTVLLALLAKRFWGTLAALATALAWLSMPVVVEFAHLVWNIHLAMALVLLAIHAYLRATETETLAMPWAIAGCAAMSLAVFTNWEPVIVCAGLLIGAWWTGRASEKRLAAAYIALAIVIAIVILGNAAYWYPQQVAETIGRLKLRMGLTDRIIVNSSLSIAHEYPRPDVIGALKHIALQHAVWVGPIAIAAAAWQLWIAFAFVRRNGRGSASAPNPAIAPMCAFFGLWFIWTAVFWSHMYIHDCQYIIAGPAVAMAFGWLVSRAAVAFASPGWKPLHSAIALLCLLAVMYPVARRVRVRIAPPPLEAGEIPHALVRYSEDIRANTPQNSVVLTLEESAVALYYSRRHLIQGIFTEKALTSTMERLPSVFPGIPYYLALKPEQPPELGDTVNHLEVLKRTPLMVLYRLPGSGRASAQPNR